MSAVEERRRVPGLDVIRGVAIALVLIRHAWPEVFEGAGIVGVTMFFALSGYLITGVLSRDLDRSGRINYRRFYAHRALRLLPALVLMLVVFTIVELAFGPKGGAGSLILGVIVGALYLQDLLPIFAYPGINHLWTLAVEEQFYLVWPAILAFSLRRRMAPRVLAVLGAASLVLVVASMLVASRFRTIEVVYPLPTNWAMALLLGGVAYLYRDRVTALLAAGRTWLLPAAACIVLAALCVMPGAKNNPATYLLGPSLIAACTVVLIFHLSRYESLPAAMAPLRRLGVISYGAYLWNGPVSTWTQEPYRLNLPPWAHWVGIVATVALAELSWVLVERRANALKDRLNVKRPRVGEPA